jgi:hypothetical protein
MAHRFVKSCLGIALCTSSAVLLSVFQINTASFRMASLGISLFAVAMTAWLFGRWPALIGSIAVSVTLAIWVFPPTGNLVIENRAELQALVLFQVAAIATSLMRPGDSGDRSAPRLQ